MHGFYSIFYLEQKKTIFNLKIKKKILDLVEMVGKNWYYSIHWHKDKLLATKTNNIPGNKAQSTNLIVIDHWFKGLATI